MAQPASNELETLRGELHRANEILHQCREEWEQWMNASEDRHEERVEAAREKLREAERQVEEIEERIRRALAGD